MVLGAVAGIGVLMVVLGFTRKPVKKRRARGGLGLRSGASGESAGLAGGAGWAARRIESDLRNNSLISQDARMVGRSIEVQAMHKLVGVAAGAGLVTLAVVLARIVGMPLPTAAIPIGGVLGALLGWWLPDSMLRSEAEKERVLFQQVAESWLELVAQLVTAGTDTFAALGAAAAYSDQPGFIVIRDALQVATANGEPPWTGLRRLSDERRLRFLDPFCAALELAGTTGAGSRQAILSQVEAARSKAMMDADAAAASPTRRWAVRWR